MSLYDFFKPWFALSLKHVTLNILDRDESSFLAAVFRKSRMLEIKQVVNLGDFSLLHSVMKYG